MFPTGPIPRPLAEELASAPLGPKRDFGPTAYQSYRPYRPYRPYRTRTPATGSIR
ncbi:hypothetical protein [Streptomyces lydicus]|uniref:hypothetical protein n=1 Tax=Streptomyces lydicus TaxID=47763 RepID=UPI0013E98734|nr:hypothetical protein [Streptomyces lydicus]MCZ1006614.1 hypothetical protein [Streptomyces lydicus]